MVELHEYMWYELIHARKFLAIFLETWPLHILPVFFSWNSS